MTQRTTIVADAGGAYSGAERAGRAFRACLAALALLAIAALPAKADFEAGLEAAQRGDCEYAITHWQAIISPELSPPSQEQIWSHHHMGLCYEFGPDAIRDLGVAASHYHFAAENGYVPSQFTLGLLYEKGLGVPQDIDLAVSYFVRAADQQHIPSLNKLGMLYFFGDKVAADHKKSFDYYRQAADLGDVFAHGGLGAHYATSVGIAPDRDLAIKHLLISARNGSVLSQIYLARVLAAEPRQPDDLISAYMWVLISRHENEPKDYLQVVRQVRNLLTDEALQLAEVRAERCVETNYEEC